MKNLRLWFCVILLQAVLSSCAGVQFMHFRGINIPEGAETISIQNFYDDSGNGPPDLNVLFTEKLKEYFQRNTDLRVVPAGGDLQFEGNIAGYDVAPASPSGAQNQQADLQRLTIRVDAVYTNLLDDTYDFDKGFSFFEDFDANQTLSEVEDDLIDRITDQIVLDIFNQSVANW